MECNGDERGEGDRVKGGGGGNKREKTEFEITCCGIVYKMATFQRSFEGTGELNVTEVTRERTPLLWSAARERALALAEGFSFNMVDAN